MLSLVQLLVHPAISAIYVTADCRCSHGVIECGVETSLQIFIIAVYDYFPKFCIPFASGGSDVCVEVFARSFCLKIPLCPLHARAGQSGADDELLSFGSFIIEPRHTSCTRLPFTDRHRHRLDFYIVKRPREFRIEIYPLVGSPPRRIAVTTQCDRIDHLDMRIDSRVPVHRFLKIKEYR